MAEHKSQKQERSLGFGPGARGQNLMAGARAKDSKKAIRKLWGYLRPYSWNILASLFLTAIATIFNIFGPSQFKVATNLLSEGLHQVTFPFQELAAVIVRLIVLYGACALAWWCSGFILAKVSTSASLDLRRNIARKLHRLPVSYYNGTSHGDILSRVTNDVDTIGQSLNQSVSQVLYSLLALLGFIVMMFLSNWLLALLTIVILPLMIFATAFLVKCSQKYFKQQQKFLGQVNGQVEEIYSGHTIVKAYGNESAVIEAFRQENEKLFTANWRAQFLSGLMMPITFFFGNLNYVLICLIGGYLVINGNIGIGVIPEFIMYIKQLNQPMSQVAQMSNVLQQTIAAAERVFEFLEEPEETDQILPSPEEPMMPVVGTVSFNHVRFHYEDSDEVVIKDFTAEIKAGQKVAIVGPTGAGKTTLVKLLMRFHDVTSGSICIDGKDITAYPRHEIRETMGMVLQDTWLTNASIADNIRYGKLDASDDAVKIAAKAAQAHHFIKSMPEGYEMEINEEANNISQGQKQLLTIARTVLADNRILILDEATSSVDTRTEILIQKAMDHLMEGRTSFIIAHRLSTIRNADLILCLDHGDIVEQGGHEELLAKNGFYAKLYNSQFEKLHKIPECG